MPRLITIMLTLFQVLFASGGVAWGNVVTAHYTVSCAPGRAAAGDWMAGTNDVPDAINITNDKGGNEAHGINTFSVKEIYSAICFMLLSQGIF